MSDHQVEASATNILDNGLFRAGSVVSVVVFAIYASFQAGQFFTAITDGQARIEKKMDRLENRVSVNTADRFRARDMRRWCRETQSMNEGWVCAEVDGPE